MRLPAGNPRGFGQGMVQRNEDVEPHLLYRELDLACVGRAKRSNLAYSMQITNLR